jgi:hypothetical protein
MCIQRREKKMRRRKRRKEWVWVCGFEEKGE